MLSKLINENVEIDVCFDSTRVGSYLYVELLLLSVILSLMFLLSAVLFVFISPYSP